MTSMNISLPDALRDYVDAQVGERYGSASEYIRELIRHDQDIAGLRAKVLAGGASPVAGPLDGLLDELLGELAVSPS